MEPLAAVNNGPLVAVVGETASGKSALAMHLAQRYDGEIISADASTVFRGFDIGTAKPSEAERQAVRHHGLDVADPSEGFTVAQFQQLANQAIAEVTARGKLALLVGGSGLYVDSVLYNYSFAEVANPQLRRELDELSVQELQARARALNLPLEQIDAQNKRRVIRLIETGGEAGKRTSLRSNTLVLGLKIAPEALAGNIEKRVDAMLEAGLTEEVRALAEHYGWHVQPMQGIGYREFNAYFSGTQSLQETRARIITHTRQLAKKQRTWFRRNKSIHWVATEAEALGLVDQFLNK
jgi:tRNA dimethylallyltransferase